MCQELISEIIKGLARTVHADPNQCGPNEEPDPQLQSQAQAVQTQVSCMLPAEVIRHHLIPALSLSALRAFRRVSKATHDDVACYAVRSIKRAPGTHPLPPDLGHRFPCLTRLDLSGDSQLVGELTLFRALRSVSQLTSLSFAGCTSLPASFVSRQLVEACPRLQHLALSCCCSGGPDAEAAMMSALAAAPLAASLTSLDLHCGNTFQPELRHLEGLGCGLTSLRMYGSRTLDDEALAVLPRHVPALEELVLAEQHSRRGRHIRGEGLAALRGLTALRALSLACPEPDARSMAASLATLTQLVELDVSRCEPLLLEALSPLSSLVCNGSGSGGILQRLSLPTAYTERQLERGLPIVFGGGGAGGGEEKGTAMAAVGLQTLCLHASAALPETVVEAISRLGNLQELSLSQCGPAGSGTVVGEAAAALTKLTSFRLIQEYGGGGDDECSTAAGGVIGPTDKDALDQAQPRVVDNTALQLHSRPGIVTWYDGLLTWRALRQLELTDIDGLDDAHLYNIGCSLSALSYCNLSRNTRITGGGFASWPSGCRRLRVLTLYDCAHLGDAALKHVSAMPLLTLTLAHLPEAGAVGVRYLAEGCKSLRSLTLERLAGAPGAALAALWRLPRLEALCLRMCNVNNLTLEMALHPSEQPAENSAAAAAAAVVAAPTAVGGGTVSIARAFPISASAASGREDAAGQETQPQQQPVLAQAQRLTWLELQGSLVSTSGLWALRHAPGLTYLNLSNCLSVGDAIADVLLQGRGSAMMLLPSLVHVDLRGCMVSEPTLERLRGYGLAINIGTGTWR